MPRTQRRDPDSQLIAIASERLPAVSVRPGPAVSHQGWQVLREIDESVGTSDSADRRRYESYIGEYPFAEFIANDIVNRIEEAGVSIDHDDFPIHLLDFIPQAAEHAVHLVKEFRALPRTYIVTIPFRKPGLSAAVELLSTMRLTDDISFVVFDDDFKRKHPLPEQSSGEGLAAIFAEGLGMSWGEIGGVQFKVQGLIGKHLGYQPHTDALNAFQGLVGLAWAFQVFDVARMRALDLGTFALIYTEFCQIRWSMCLRST